MATAFVAPFAIVFKGVETEIAPPILPWKSVSRHLDAPGQGDWTNFCRACSPISSSFCFSFVFKQKKRACLSLVCRFLATLKGGVIRIFSWPVDGIGLSNDVFHLKFSLILIAMLLVHLVHLTGFWQLVAGLGASGLILFLRDCVVERWLSGPIVSAKDRQVSYSTSPSLLPHENPTITDWMCRFVRI